MEKAYDLKDLGQKMKDAGLPIALDALEAAGAKAYVALKAWATESAALSENKVDDIVAPFYGHLDVMVLPLIDKIDGVVGG
jgi:hypothetical protein